MDTHDPIHYDVAISFAGEDREVARAIADQLTKLDIRVFYDEYEQYQLWGKDLYSHLSDIYQNKSKYCIMIISQYYAHKVWTKHERAAAQARAMNENREYILPLRVDETTIPGLVPTIGYISWEGGAALNSIVNAIQFKLKEQNVEPPGQPPIKKRPKRSHPIVWQELPIRFIETFDVVEDLMRKKSNDYYLNWMPEQDEIWTSSLEQGNYVLENLTDKTAVRYRWLSIDEDKENMMVSIDVKMEMDDNAINLAGCGLLLCFQHDTKYYYAFTLSKANAYQFLKRGESGFNILFGGRLGQLAVGEYVTLGAAIERNDFYLYINGTMVRRIGVKDLVFGDAGIIAVGTGKFYFDNLCFYK